MILKATQIYVMGIDTTPAAQIVKLMRRHWVKSRYSLADMPLCRFFEIAQLFKKNQMYTKGKVMQKMMLFQNCRVLGYLK
jgi:hypothetical protein